MPTKSRAKTILAIISVGGYILITIAFVSILFFFGDQIKIPEGQVGLQIVGMVGMLVGTWNAAMMLVYTYFYGTSEGSSNKTDIMKQQLEKTLNK